MKGNFEKSKKFRNLIKSDFDLDLILPNLKYFVQDDLERHKKENKICIDFYQAWKKASNFNAFLDCLNSQNFIENNPTTASWLYDYKALTVEVDAFLNNEKGKHFMTYADRGGILLTDKSNSNEMLISNHYGDGNTFIHIYENEKPLLDGASGVLQLSDVTISGVWNLKEYDCDRNSETLHVLKGAYFVYIEKKIIIFERYRTLEELRKK